MEQTGLPGPLEEMPSPAALGWRVTPSSRRPESQYVQWSLTEQQGQQAAESLLEAGA